MMPSEGGYPSSSSIVQRLEDRYQCENLPSVVLRIFVEIRANVSMYDACFKPVMRVEYTNK